MILFNVQMVVAVFFTCMFFCGYTAYGDTIEVVTGRGNVFVLDVDESAASYGKNTGDGTGDGSSDASGTSMLDGIGINSRLIRNEYDGTIISGSGLVGSETSTRPYHDLESNTRFVVAASDESESMIIPEFYMNYRYDNGILTKTSGDHPNILGYSQYRAISGNVDATINNGIIFEGAGRTILKLGDYTNQNLVLTGDLSDGTMMRIIQSPYDLMGIPYTGSGFLIHHCLCDPSTQDISVLAGSTEDSHKSGSFEYTQSASASVYHGKCCKGRYLTEDSFDQSVPVVLFMRSHNSGYVEIVGDGTTPQNMELQNIMRPGAKLFRLHYNVVGDFDHRIYDTLPAKQLLNTFSDTFESTVTFPSGVTYLVVDSAGGTSQIRGTALEDREFLGITGLPPDTGYRIMRDSHTIAIGITDNAGAITIPVFDGNAFVQQGGTLHLYGDSLTHLGVTTDSNVVFDHINGRTLLVPSPSPEPKIYNVHAYVKIPVLGDDNIQISGVSLDGILPLPYLDGVYTEGNSIFVPVIPTYKTIHLAINNAETSLAISDVLGGTGLYIADSVSSDITLNRPDEFIHEISATAGAVTYMISTHGGDAKAHVQATISGSTEIINTRNYWLDPPPPPPPRPIDPLTTWIEVYINGELTPINGEYKTQIFFSDTPDTDHIAQSAGVSSTHIARFSYPEITVTDTISVPVQAADYVEFYFYNQINAQGSIPPVPPGYLESGRSSTATAVAVLEHASINTSM